MVKRWTKNLTECKIYANLDELAREKHLLGKKAKVICFNEVLIFYPLLAATVGIRENYPTE